MANVFSRLRIWDGGRDSYLNFLDADSIAVEDGKIAAVGKGWRGENCAGLTVIPGLIDAHVHMVLDPSLKSATAQVGESAAAIRAKLPVRAEAMVRAGITSARDLGGGAWLELELRDRIAAGEVIGPRLVCAGQPITSVGGHCHFWNGEAASVQEAEEVVERQRAAGVDLIKVMATGGNLTPRSRPSDAQFDGGEMRAIVAAAARFGFPVAAHCHGTSGIRNAARAGVRTIEHCSWLGADGKRGAYDPLVAREIVRQGIWVSPTVNAGWARFGEAFAKVVTAGFRAMKDEGCRLVASTDAGIPNVHHHDLGRALPVFARLAELTPVQTLRAATSDCAAAIGLGGVTGRIAEGFAADLVFLGGDPLSDLGALVNPVRVVAAGRLLDNPGSRQVV